MVETGTVAFQDRYVLVPQDFGILHPPLEGLDSRPVGKGLRMELSWE